MFRVRNVWAVERQDSTVAPEKLEENSADGIPAIQVNNQIRKEEITINPEIVEKYGSWMLALRRPRRHRSKPNAQGLEETLHEKGNQNEPHHQNISFTKLKVSCPTLVWAKRRVTPRNIP